MKINPVYLKDLRLNVRSMKFAMIIFTYNLCLGLIIILFMYVSMHNVTGQLVFNYENCERLYLIISGIEFGSIFFIVPALTVGTVAGEREKRTLDLLLVSKLSPFHIICGKMSYAVTIIFILIVSDFPLTAMVAVTHSIEMKIQWQLLILLLVTSLYIASIGVFFSTIKKSTIAATLWTYGVILLITIGTIVIYNLNGYVLEDMKVHSANEFNVVYYSFLFNPLATYVYMFSSTRPGTISNWIPTNMKNNWVELSIFFQLAISVVLLGVSAIHLDPRSVDTKLTFWHKSKKRKTL
ncbi:MAG TPA: hypothetical protein DCW90_13570 [Lachnospiraceae bacterium]|nr:ABC transporter permease subunit [uncultured Lachnoclostridium sp.]HAU86476.1 hypothetical protein [Lachnospiraceae bacterium]